MSKMTEAALVNFLLGLAVPGVQDIEFGPKKTADAPNAVSPSEAATVLQFGRVQSVGSGFFDFTGNLAEATWGDEGGFPLRLEEAEKGFGGLRKGWWASTTGQAKSLLKGKEGAAGHPKILACSVTGQNQQTRKTFFRNSGKLRKQNASWQIHSRC
jgi:hypothetical protein